MPLMGLAVRCCGYVGNHCKTVALASCFFFGAGAFYKKKHGCAEQSKNPMPKVYVNRTCIPGMLVLEVGMLILLVANDYQYLCTALFYFVHCKNRGRCFLNIEIGIYVRALRGVGVSTIFFVTQCLVLPHRP